METRSVKMNEKGHLEVWNCPVQEIVGEPDMYVSVGSDVDVILGKYGLTEDMVDGCAIVQVPIQ